MQDGRSIKAYIDTGSKQNIIRRECFETLGDYQINPSSIVLKGFGGAMCTVKGEVTLPLTVDKVVRALIADCELAGADILLGQPALATEGVVLTVHDGKAQLTSTEKEKAEDFIPNITLGDDETEAQVTEKVLALEDVTVSPGEESDILIVVEGLYQGEKGYGERNGAVVAIGNHVLEGGRSDGLKVRNLGHRLVQWKTGQVVARAVKMSVAIPKKQGEISSTIFASHSILNLSCIQVGDIGRTNLSK
ncbi:unnamed protein product [Ceutorhynchus assimilis]|uniref:Peptidase A2 domain-containing protein n=1 Tax=Ceutorhynchus assimilis TaxID=467358 RepID=A0A9N9QEQ2_9CUCU|nr:unnamed protein product [Ceutorhynchus assimilis]